MYSSFVIFSAIIVLSVAQTTDPTKINATMHLGQLPTQGYATAMVADLKYGESVQEQFEYGGIANVTIVWDFNTNSYGEFWTSIYDPSLRLTQTWYQNTSTIFKNN